MRHYLIDYNAISAQARADAPDGVSTRSTSRSWRRTSRGWDGSIPWGSGIPRCRRWGSESGIVRHQLASRLPEPRLRRPHGRDIRWGAKIVAGFTDEHIRAAVASAHYTDPRAADTSPGSSSNAGQLHSSALARTNRKVTSVSMTVSVARHGVPAPDRGTRVGDLLCHGCVHIGR